MSPYTEYPYYEFFLHILKALGNPLFVNLYQSTIFFGHPSIMHLGDKAYVYGYMTYLKGPQHRYFPFVRHPITVR